MVDEALTETGAVQSRIRALPSRVVVYLLLAAALFAECGYRQGGGHLVARLGGRWGLTISPVVRGGGGPPCPPRRCPPPPAVSALPRCERCSTCCAARPPA